VIHRALLTAVLLSLVVLAQVGPALSQEPVEEPVGPPPVAIVNGVEISGDDWVSYLKAYHGSNGMRALIEEQLIDQEAAKLGLSITDAELDARIVRLKTDYPDDGAFRADLQQRGISLNALKRQLKTDMLLDKIVEQQGAVTDEEVHAYYEAHPSEFSTPERVKLHVITTDTIQKCYLAAERLAHEEFAIVAADPSVDEHAANGGFWGELTREEIQPEAVQVKAFLLEPGATSEPLEVEGKYYVVRVEEKTGGTMLSEIEVAPQIKEQLLAQKGISTAAVRRGIVRRADVTIKASGLAHLTRELRDMGERQVVVDGQPVPLSQPPIVEKRLLVPGNVFAEALGASYEWFSTTQTVRIIRGETTILIGTNSTVAIVNEARENVEQPAVERNGTVYVPARWVTEKLGGSVYWSQADYTLYVKSVKEEEPEETVVPVESP